MPSANYSDYSTPLRGGRPWLITASSCELDQERQRLAFLFIVPAHARVGWPLPDGHRGGRSLARIRAPECS